MTSPGLHQTLDELRDKALAELSGVAHSDDLNKWRIFYLGRKGLLTGILRSLKDLGHEERRAVGAMANNVKTVLEEAAANVDTRIKEGRMSILAHEESIDVTRPGRVLTAGRFHPITQMLREICAAFLAMGFQIVEGPEVEWDRYNFELLNIPKDHPARDMWNTLWVDCSGEEDSQTMLLRTHTSPMQARVMENTKPPIRVIVPGKCYRYEATDATHEWHFYQVEGLAVDEGITFADLKGTLYEFAKRIFGPDRKVRFRCDYFPFVEPGVDMAIDCFACQGEGCRICKDSGWIEILGAGMVHPRVLEGVGYDPSRYTGFAFGLGPERIAMLKHGIDDIRLFYSNDLRFLQQF